jgi:hypothetical protein
MPAWLGICGFEGQATAYDRITVSSGTAAYDAVSVPPGGSLYSCGGNGLSLRIPWHRDDTAGRWEPAACHVWMHASYITNVNTTNNDGLRIGLGSNGAEYITISAEDLTNKVTIRIAGTLRATAASGAFSTGTWERLHLFIEGQSTGDVVSVYMDGNLSTPVVTYTLVGADQTALAAVGSGKPNEFYMIAKSGDSTGRWDNLFALDADDVDMPNIDELLEPSVAPRRPTGDGTEQDWSGSYTDIDDVPASDADKCTSTAVGDESTFTHAAIAEDNVYAVKQILRVTRSGTDAGSNIALRSRSATDVASQTVPAPGDGYVQWIWEADPDDQPWSPVTFDAARLGFQTVT